MFHYVLTCMGMKDCTRTHTQTDSALCGSVSISLPHCESLAIPDAGWSAEPGWPETISDPRGGCTLQWAPRPWLKHQPHSYATPTTRQKGGGGSQKNEWWRSVEFSSICCLCCWLKGRLCSLFYALGSIRMLYRSRSGLHTGRSLITPSMKKNWHLHKSTTASGLLLQPCCYLLWRL